MTNVIGIIDIGYGNVTPLVNMLEYLCFESRLISNSKDINHCDRLIIPGVGAFDNFMSLLKKKDLVDPIKHYSRTGMPILGICVGAQVLGYNSEEGVQAGLGLIPMSVKHLKKITSNLKLPNIGWNSIEYVKHDLFNQLSTTARFYFAHSYYFELDEGSKCLAYASYEAKYCAIVDYQNTIGIQFHPEKSHKHGFKIIENFCTL